MLPRPVIARARVVAISISGRPYSQASRAASFRLAGTAATATPGARARPAAAIIHSRRFIRIAPQASVIGGSR